MKDNLEMKEIIKQHFTTQQLRFERASLEFGLSPLVSYLLATILFIALSILWLSKGNLSQWSYAIPAILILFVMAHPDRLRFYKQIYSERAFDYIRRIENLILVSPFLLVLLLYGYYLVAVILFLIILLISENGRGRWTTITLPTPFYKYPFEFASGFRYSWILIIGSYSLFIISYCVNNEALGIVTLISLSLSSTLYYQYPEKEFFIWIHSHDSKSFIIQKIKIGLGYTFLIVFPMFFMVLFTWPSFALWTILGVVSALMFVATTIVAKYVIYPHLFNLPLVLLLSLGLIVPPLLLFIFPYLMNRAIKKMKPILS